MHTDDPQENAAPAEHERGFALVLVIWVVGLLALLAASVATDSRSEAVIAQNRVGAAQARALADAGVTLAILGILDSDPLTQWHGDGTARQIAYGGGTIVIRVQDEGGKIDLNTAPIELVGGLLDERGVEPGERSAMVDGIVARRKAFAPNAVAQALAHVDPQAGDIGTRPFADVSELRMLPNVSRDAYDRIAPFLTVYSQNATLNPATAPREDLLAVPGIGINEVDAYIAARNLPNPVPTTAPLSGVGKYIMAGPMNAVTITAIGTSATGMVFSRDAVAIISGNLPMQPYRILRWSRTPEPTAAIAGLQ